MSASSSIVLQGLSLAQHVAATSVPQDDAPTQLQRPNADCPHALYYCKQHLLFQAALLLDHSLPTAVWVQ
jgi:hypothetical protein